MKSSSVWLQTKRIQDYIEIFGLRLAGEETLSTSRTQSYHFRLSKYLIDLDCSLIDDCSLQLLSVLIISQHDFVMIVDVL